VRFYNQDFAGAINDFSTAIDLDQRLAQAYRNRGYAYLAQGKEDEAEKDFTVAVTMAPLLGPEIDAKVKIIRSWRK